MNILPIRWKLQQKTLVLSLLIAIFPFIISNVFWYINAQDTLHRNAEDTMISSVQEATNETNSFLNTKLLGFLSHSQNAAILSGDKNLIEEDLLNLFQQDTDIFSLTYADASGQEVVKLDRNKVYTKSQLKNIANSSEFKVATFDYGKEYISPIQFARGKSPQITIAVPVVFPQNSQSLLTFSSVNKTQRKPGDVFGVVIGVINLTHFGESISSLKIGKTGYVYIVDNNGIIVTHPNSNYIGTKNKGQTYTKMYSFLSRGLLDNSAIKPYTVTSLANVPVLTTLSVISRTGWAAVAEEPTTDISSDITRIQQQAFLLFLFPLALIFFLSFLFARKLVKPIEELVKGTVNVGKGDFDYQFSIKTGDELEQLAHEYHTMAKKLKHDRNSLLAEKNTLSLVLGNIADGVLALDEAYTVLFSNTAVSHMTGLKSDALVGKEIDKVLTIKEKNTKTSIETFCKQSKDEISSHTVTLSTFDKQIKTFYVIIAPLEHSIRSEIRYIVTFYDITKEQELENMKIDFVSMAAHELRTPLTSIRGYASLLGEELDTKMNKEQKQFMVRLTYSIRSLSNLIDNLLNASRIEKGTFRLEIQPNNIGEIVESIIRDLKEIAKSKDQSLTLVKSKNQFPLVLVDRSRIGEVVTNLVANAINYTNSKGKITVSISEKDTNILISVSDTGQGIPKDAISYLFTKFFRVAGKLEQGSKGTGLGLFISKSIITLHKGKIWVESTLGKGSTFFFTLPIASEADLKKYSENKRTLSQQPGVIFNPEKYPQSKEKALSEGSKS